jgi:putative transposase
MTQRNKAKPLATDLTEEQRQLAMERFDALRPHIEDDASLAHAARQAGISVRTAERWLARYRQVGLAGLARSIRSDAEARRLPDDLLTVIEGMGLKKPRASAAAIHRRVSSLASAQGWAIPSYSTVYAILADLDPAMVALAHEGASAFRNRYELIHRHRADSANAIWQADHTMLDLLILDQRGKPARPWLTTVIDDYSRAIAGIMVFFGAPSILNTSLALRQAIWRKGDAAWPVCGIPDMLYVDHGSDFTSKHLDQVAASLRFRIVYSAVGMVDIVALNEALRLQELGPQRGGTATLVEAFLRILHAGLSKAPKNGSSPCAANSPDYKAEAFSNDARRATA